MLCVIPTKYPPARFVGVAYALYQTDLLRLVIEVGL